MDVVVSFLGTVILVAALGFDLARQRRRAAPSAQLEPFGIWFLRVWAFSVLALPFYFWRTRGRPRWALVGIVVGALYLVALTGAVSLVAPGCSAGNPDANAPTARGDGADPRAPDAQVSTSEPSRPSPGGDAAVDRALRSLKGPRFPDVLAARDVLVAASSPRVVAALVEMSRSPERVPLTDTADLIYPGTRRFHGHGFVVPYDIDRLGARAGWVLERITFRRFGFARSAHPDAPEPAERPDAADRAAAWWTAQRGRFDRVSALAAALRAGADAHADFVLEVVAKDPLDEPVRAALASQIVPALRAGLDAGGEARTLACRAARFVVLRHLSKTDARLQTPFDRHLAGDANLVAALQTTLRPELTLDAEVPGAAEILSPAYSVTARNALDELVRRLAYARGPDRVGITLAPGRISIYEGDLAREAEAWKAWLR